MLSAKKELFTRPSGGYQISRSVRFRSSASAYLNRTFGNAATNNLKGTLSCWVKRGTLGAQVDIISCYNGSSSASTDLYFNSSNQLQFDFGNTAANSLITTQVFRDPSAWYHIVLAVDTTQATAANRCLLYVNGVQVTSFSSSTYPAQNTVFQIVSINANNRIGTNWNNSGAFFDGYLTEVNFIDGQALTPSSFGENDAVTGVWKPKKYTGTYGTNGFYLNFSDNSAATAAAIGKDYSGNSNNWTPNNISVTAGVTYDSMLDVPTLNSASAANFAVLNPLFRNASLISEGNLYFNKSTIGWATGQATMSLPASKTYFEATATLIGGANSGVYIGVATSSATQDTYQVANQWSFGGSGGVLNLYNQTTLVTPSGSSAAGDILQVAYDGTTGYLWFGKNNTWYDSAGGTTGNPSTGANPTITLTAGTEIFPCAICYANGLKFTFGQRPFTYTPPTGFKALNTQNLPDATIKKGNLFFDATTYTGNGSTQSVVNAGGFQPDFVWLKNRTAAYTNLLFDAIRGTGNYLQSNTTDPESAGGATFLSSFNSNGFSVGSYVGVNNSGNALVGWQWNAGNNTISNTAGSITSQVRANPTAGISVLTYTGTGANATVGHGLGVAPKMVIVKRRNAAASWIVWHTTFAGTEYNVMESIAAKATLAAMWNSAVPTSTVINLGSNANTNGSADTYVAYCFAEVAGFSKMGSYTGNGSADGPFIYCGFRPKYLLVKRSDSTGNWFEWDSARDPYNTVLRELYADASGAEYTRSGSSDSLDFVSNGVKMRMSSALADRNASGGTYIFMAFAENPFKNSLAR